LFEKILIANRGEIACRVIKSAKSLGIKTVAIYSEADKKSLHVQMADEAVFIGPPPVNQSYILSDNIMEAIATTGSDAVHPGYGFLSENSQFAKRLEEAGITFIGPPVKAIEAMGDKIASKKIAHESGVSTVPGYLGEINSPEHALEIACEIGFPVMIKASAGGGGKGMRIAWDKEGVAEGYQSSRNEASSSFGDDRILIEKFITSPRHIEIQVLGDKHGNFVYLNERECSIQRRNQKVIEEAPSPFLNQNTRKAMGNQAVSLAKAVDYFSAGTVEFIVDSDRNFYFLEMNTRLQVEHPVTELITGVDLVKEMINVADGKKLPLTQEQVGIDGWAFESRVYAEDPRRNFLPSIGRITKYSPPTEFNDGSNAIRNDTGVFEGGEISVHYDPMIAKLCTWSTDRKSAIETMRKALDTFEIEGITSNISFLSAVFDHPKFKSGDITTGFIEEEFAEGFSGVEHSEETIERIASCVTMMHRFSEIRRTRISGRLANHMRKVGNDWIARINQTELNISLDPFKNGCRVKVNNAKELTITSAWTPGKTLAEFEIGGDQMQLRVKPISEGYHIEYRGAELDVLVRTGRQQELGSYMKEKELPDTSKYLLCPMPGLITEIHVSVGDKVEDGQPLCTVEAMKMENVLKASRKGTIKSIAVTPGSSLTVDQVILEFE